MVVLLLALPLLAGAQDKTLHKWIKAVSKEKPAAAEKLCTEGFWNVKVDNGQAFYEQCVRKQFQLLKAADQIRDDRAVLAVEIRREGKKVDMINIYMVIEGKDWLIDGVDESDSHPRYFLDGQLSGHFHPEELPTLPRLDELAHKLLEARGNQPMQQQIIQDYLNGFHSDEIFQRLCSFSAPIIPSH